jgi:hypothetical protein
MADIRYQESEAKDQNGSVAGGGASSAGKYSVF